MQLIFLIGNFMQEKRLFGSNWLCRKEGGSYRQEDS